MKRSEQQVVALHLAAIQEHVKKAREALAAPTSAFTVHDVPRKPRPFKRPGAGVTPGAAITRIREHLGMTQREFAKAVGVTPTAVSHWEAGRWRVKPKNMAHVLALPGRERHALQTKQSAQTVTSLRKGLGMSRAQLAEAVGATREAVRLWEHGVVVPNGSHGQRLVELLKR